MRASGAAVDGPSEEPGEPTTRPTPTPAHSYQPRARAWAELLRLPALFTVPGDALAGAAAASVRPTPRTLLAIASSLCLYEAGMALNDWADRDVDAVERPHRPLPSGRIRPAAALGAACALTGAGLTLAACAGRPALAVAVPLATTVWAYDLALKNTPAGPFAMATARALDLLLGAAATTGAGGVARESAGSGGSGGSGGWPWPADVGRVGPSLPPTALLGLRRAPSFTTLSDDRQPLPSTALLGIRRALPSAALLGAHILAVTTVSRREAQGGSPLAPFAALAATAALTRTVARRRSLPSPPDLPGPAERADLAATATATATATAAVAALSPLPRPPRQPRAGSEPLDTHAALRLALAAAYAATAARPCFHATLNPSPPLTQRAVTAGIRATIPLQAALAARSGTKGTTVTALLTTALAPLAARFARRVSVT